MQNSGSEMHEMCVLPELLTYFFFLPLQKFAEKEGLPVVQHFFNLFFFCVRHVYQVMSQKYIEQCSHHNTIASHWKVVKE